MQSMDARAYTHIMPFFGLVGLSEQISTILFEFWMSNATSS